MNYSVIYFNEIKLALDKRKQQQKKSREETYDFKSFRVPK